MFFKVLSEIKRSNKIIILRHKDPDFDAYGSQLGLYFSLKRAFPNKEILLDGDENQNNVFGIKITMLEEKDYSNALVIVADTSTNTLMYNENYLKAKKIIVFDHHESAGEFGDTKIIKSSYSSTCELITEFLYKTKIPITKEAADALYIGLVGDSFRFYYKGTSSNTFKMAYILTKCGADIINDYKLMAKEESEGDKHFKGYVLSNFKTYDKVAYIYISKEDRLKYNAEESFASRGTINLLSSIEGVEAFCNFVEFDDEHIEIELRSKQIPVIDVARAHNGGGHALACGARIEKSENYLDIVKELNLIVGGKNE